MTAPVSNARNARAAAALSARAAAGKFAEALRSARRQAAAAGRREPPAAAARPLAARKAAQIATEARQTDRDATAAAADQKAAVQVAADAPIEGLRAAVRALPASIDAARLHDGARVSLSFGSALGVDLRSGAQGLEVTLRPAEALGRAAAAELPGLVAALRARGLRVARAEVRARPGSSGGGWRASAQPALTIGWSSDTKAPNGTVAKW